MLQITIHPHHALRYAKMELGSIQTLPIAIQMELLMAAMQTAQ